MAGEFVLKKMKLILIVASVVQEKFTERGRSLRLQGQNSKTNIKCVCHKHT